MESAATLKVPQNIVFAGLLMCHCQITILNSMTLQLTRPLR